MEKFDDVENNLGVRLKTYRKKQGMTQGDIANVLKISVDYVSKIEKGDREPNVHVKEKIVELLTGKGEMLREGRAQSADPFISEIVTILMDLDEKGRQAVLQVAKEKLEILSLKRMVEGFAESEKKETGLKRSGCDEKSKQRSAAKP